MRWMNDRYVCMCVVDALVLTACSSVGCMCI